MRTTLILLLISAGALTAGEATVLYVSPVGNDAWSGQFAEAKGNDGPLATLAGARDAVCKLKKNGPIEVRVRGGFYTLNEPVVFTPEDSGTAAAPIVYTANAGETPVLSGGRRIAGWQKGPNSIWTADLPDVKAGKWSFRQLFVNGEKRRRARNPNEGFLRVKGFPDGGKEVHYHTDCQRFEFAPGDLKADWRNLNDVEVIVYHFWTDSHLPIQSIDTKTNIVTFAHKAGKVFTDDFTSNGARYIVENVFEGLDQPGEWYLDKKEGRIYYFAKDGENPNAAEVIAPFAPAHLFLQGDPAKGQFIEHLTFRNLSFLYSNFELPKGNSNDKQGSASVPATIVLKGTRHCLFECCDVSNLGTFAFDVTEGCSENVFRQNRVRHVGAGGFRVNGGTERSPILERTERNVIEDNAIEYYGDEYPSAVGVLMMNTAGNTVAHNEIAHGWYTGVSVGWVWGYGRSVSRDNVVEFNHIHDIGQGLLSDMGAIYTLGVSPGTVLRNNLIHDVDANQYGGWGIYHDEGSSHLLVENNVVYNTKFAGFNIHYSKEVTVRNNIFAFGRLEQVCRGRVEPHLSVFFEQNIVYWKEGELLSKNWKDKPYEFYLQPPKGNNKSGMRQVTSTFEMDHNLYFNPTKKLDAVKFNGRTWADWQKEDKDKNSVYADPQFVDPETYDFRLKPGSPAFKLGFRPIDVSTAGPRVKPGPRP